MQEHIPPITDEEMQVTEGANCGWVTFSKEFGHTGQDVAATLAGKGTGWCIAGRETAQGEYLDQGAKLHIYYTRDTNGNQANPRVVIVEMGGKVTEVRGIEWEENVDDYMKAADVIGNKLKELPGGEEFFATDADTKYLTAIDRKVRSSEALTGPELIFLYELFRSIKYFGHKKDPRIEELKARRDPRKDLVTIVDYFIETNQQLHQEFADAIKLLAIIEKDPQSLTPEELRFVYQVERLVQAPESFSSFLEKVRKEILSVRNPKTDVPDILDCDPGAIAWNRHEVSTHTKAYIGPLFPGIFEEFNGLEHIYTSFPEGKITRDEVVIGTKDRKELLKAMKEQGIKFISSVQEMIESPDFMPTQSGLRGIKRLFKGKRSPTPETVDIVRLKVRDFGFTNYPTTTDLFAKAKEFGLDLCPAEVGPQYRLQQTDQPMDDCFYICMQPLVASGNPSVFMLKHRYFGLCLYDRWAPPGARWSLDNEFVFRFRKKHEKVTL